MKRPGVIILVVAVGAILLAQVAVHAQSNSSAYSQTQRRGRPGSSGIGPYRLAPARVVALSEDEAADITFVREEEKLARDVYRRLYEAWHLTSFSRIAFAEQRHMDAMQTLLLRYQLPDPAAANASGVFKNEKLQGLYDKLIADGGQSPTAALKVGALIEEVDIQDILAAMDRSRKSDVVGVYQRLDCGSQNHLRSFARNYELQTGQRYVAQVLSQAKVDEILTGSTQRCGWTTR